MRGAWPCLSPPLLSFAFPFSSPFLLHARPFLLPARMFSSQLPPRSLCMAAAPQARSLSLPPKLRVAGTGSSHSSSSRSPGLPDPLLSPGFPSSQQGPSPGPQAQSPPSCLVAGRAPERRAGAGPERTFRARRVPPEPCLPPQGSHCSSSGDPAEYNLRSRTVLCGTCGQPADKASAGSSGAAVGGSISSGSSASSVTVTRSYRSVGGSGGGSFGDSLVTRSYLLGNSSRRTQVSPRFARAPAGRGRGSLRVRTRGPCGGEAFSSAARGSGSLLPQPKVLAGGLLHPAPPV